VVLDVEVEVLDDRRLATFVLKGHIVERDIVDDARQIRRARPVGAVVIIGG